MTKVFSRWPLKEEALGQSQAIQCGIYIGQSATRTGFPFRHHSICSILIPSVIINVY